MAVCTPKTRSPAKPRRGTEPARCAEDRLKPRVIPDVGLCTEIYNSDSLALQHVRLADGRRLDLWTLEHPDRKGG